MPASIRQPPVSRSLSNSEHYSMQNRLIKNEYVHLIAALAETLYTKINTGNALQCYHVLSTYIQVECSRCPSVWGNERKTQIERGL